MHSGIRLPAWGAVVVLCLHGASSAADTTIADDGAHMTAALTWYCTAVDSALTDRTRPLIERMDEIEENARNTRHFPFLDAFFKELGSTVDPNAPADEIYDSILTIAVRKGAKDWSCPSLKRAFEMTLRGEDDIDRSQLASAEEDFELLCSLARQYLQSSDGDQSHRLTLFAQELDQKLTNPEVRSAFDALAIVPGPDRIDFLRQAAANQGIPDWHCDALEKNFAPTEE